MEATMFQLRLFVHQRLYGAAEEILGEVEKTITLALHEAHVYRSKDEAGSLPHQLAHLPNKSAAEPPVANSAVEHGDKRDSPLLQENQGPPTPEESNVTVSNLSADLSNNSWSYCLVEMPEVKKEQEEHGDGSETPEIFVSLPRIVKSEEERSEMQISHEMQPLSSDSSAAASDEEMANSSGEEQPKMVKEKEKTLQGKTVGDNKKDRAALSNENCSSKGKKDRSFCHLCGKGFYYIAALKKHINTHKMCTNCILCGRKYKYTKELVRHLKTKHSTAFFCDVCGKTFSYFRCLQTHKKTHTHIDDLMCRECGRTFHRRDHLTVHVRTHSGEKPYHCDVCEKSFSQSQNLRIHKRSHSRERPYQCFQCGKLCTTSGQLKTHVRHHTGEKPYACDFCGKCFFQSGRMKRHRAIHTGEGPFAVD